MGTRVHIRSQINGTNTWQTREICGGACALDASADLASWTHLTNFTQKSATYIDSAAASNQRFYRLR